MKEYVRRMISEKTELSTRIEKAKKTIEQPPYGMSVEQIRMLSEQVKAMESYLYWLNERLRYEAEVNGN
jgi:hypothetical protein